MSGLIGRIASEVNRWRHRRGFGVHSPSAYVMMTDVVRPSRLYGLYSYYYLDCLLERMSAPSAMLMKARERMRLLLRLCCHLAPSSLKITADKTATPLTAKLLGELSRLSGVTTCGENTAPGLWVIAATEDNRDRICKMQEEMKEALAQGAAIVLLDKATSISESLFETMSGGIRIELRDMVILRPLSSSARASYTA